MAERNAHDFPYSIPEHRALTTAERAIVRLLVTATCPERLGEVERLEVVARCGCGKCPTILFHTVPSGADATARVLADYWGGDPRTGLVGVMLWERNGRLSELEAWSIDGEEVKAWPKLETLRPMESGSRDAS